jgi:uncharacterized protein (DUF427 family)
MERTEPGPNQESVWDYPRPPALEDVSKHLKVEFNGEVIAETERGKRVLETSQPPAYYFPPEDVDDEFLQELNQFTYCEWKGHAYYFDVNMNGKIARKSAWYYPDPNQKYEGIKDYVAFYPDALNCFVDGEKVQPQEGTFYGGWITSEIVGPFKGGPGTSGW